MKKNLFYVEIYDQESSKNLGFDLNYFGMVIKHTKETEFRTSLPFIYFTII